MLNNEQDIFTCSFSLSVSSTCYLALHHFSHLSASWSWESRQKRLLS